MKSIKVLYMGRALRDVYPHATKFQVWKWRVQEFLKKVLRFATMTGLTAGILYATFMAGAYFNPVISYAVQEKIIATEVKSPVMDRIGGCESQGNPKAKLTHYAKDGQFLTHANSNGTVDVGGYQINQSVWGRKATELGFNIFTEDGNEKMAMWIYKNKGTDPWYSSRACWN